MDYGGLTLINKKIMHLPYHLISNPRHLKYPSSVRLSSCSADERSRASGSSLLSLSPHTDGLTPGPRQVNLPFPSPVDTGLPHRHRGSAGIPYFYGFVPQPDSSSYFCPAFLHEAASFALCYGLRVWLAPLAEYDPGP